MSKNKPGEYIQLAIAAARAAYGDFTGLASEGVKYLPGILAVLVALLIIVVVLPVLFIQSLFTGDRSTPSGTFSELAVDALRYKDDWITVLAIAQTKKVRTGSRADLTGAYQALKDGKISEYLQGDSDTDGDIMDFYNRNLELLQSLLCNYAGYEYFYDEIPEPSSNTSVKKVYNEDYGFHVLEKEYLTDKGTSTRIIYSGNDVVNYKVDNGLIKIKYRKYCLKAYFPIAKEYEASYSNDFGAGRTHNGKAASHEGNDIFAERNTPILAIEDCKIRKIGWNALGGWRILMESMDGLRVYYYAHMEDYADRLQKYKDSSGRIYENPGVKVKAGEVIGYVGSSGSFNSNTPPGADTGTPSHIHLQMWVISKGWFSQKETLINPYYCLKLLENNKYGKDVELNKEKLKEEGL